MAETNGKLLTCDRCGKQIFLKCVGEGEADGGYTRWNNFEKPPKGWDFVNVPKNIRGECANVHSSFIRVCPECYALWEKVIHEHFTDGTKCEYILIDETEMKGCKN